MYRVEYFDHFSKMWVRSLGHFVKNNMSLDYYQGYTDGLNSGNNGMRYRIIAE